MHWFKLFFSFIQNKDLLEEALVCGKALDRDLSEHRRYHEDLQSVLHGLVALTDDCSAAGCLQFYSHY